MIIRTPTTAAVTGSSVVAGTGAASSTTGAAPWRALFLQHLSQMASPVGAISTLHPDSVAGKATPRVRHCVFRGLWAGLPDRATNPAPRNPPVYETDLPVFTTDARMAKAWELTASGASGAEGSAGCGGGPIEATWWAPSAGTQWRIRGTAWLLGGPGSSAAALAAIQPRMRRREGKSSGTGEQKKEEESWSWSREITGHFGNMSPAMRGGFCNPPPGQPRPSADNGGERSRLGKPVADDDLENPAARANFRVCVIVPDHVDQVDLSRGDDPRRWLYTYVGAGGKAVHEGGVVEGEWEKLEVWP